MTQAANLAALGTNAGTTGILPIAGGGTAGTNGAIGFKNRIINGNMVISQRGTSFAFTNGTTSTYTLDRWRCDDQAGANFTISQSATAPVGFSNSLLVTTSSGNGSISGGQYSIVQQQIEGNNINDLNWGTANAKAVTLSFWVQSSFTGTFGGSVRDNAATYSFPFSYTISAANTWTYVSIPVAGPTSGSFSATNGLAATVFFSLGTSTAIAGAAGSWSSGNYLTSTAAGATGVASTTGATWYITGVQLEVGTAATNFDFRSIGTELALCQRYYQFGGNSFFSNYGGSSSGLIMLFYKVSMRATPTITSTLSPSSGSGVSTEVGNIYILTNSTSPTTWTATAEL